VAASLALPATMLAFQDRLIFFPQPILGPEPRARPGLESVEVAVADGARVRGWLVRTPTTPAPAPLVIYFGGNAEEVSWLVDAAPRLGGWSLLLVNYRGYGRSEGKPGQAALFADALALHDWARARVDVAPGRIVAMGRSLGSGVAVHLAAERPLAGVVLVTPFDSLTAVAQRHYPWLPVRWLLRHPFDSVARAPSIRAPMLCLAAGRDQVIPPVHAARLRDAWGGPHRWLELPVADHDNISAEPAYWSAIAEFLGGLR
jgi:hypothetical protein